MIGIADRPRARYDAGAMGTWLGVVVETRDRSDFWEIAQRHQVVPQVRSAAPHVFIECQAQLYFNAPMRLAEALSRDLATMAIGFLAQTATDVHKLSVFRRGVCVRRLVYSRDQGGWVRAAGAPQSFERFYFFGGEQKPDMLDDDASREDIARYRVAREAGDATGILDILHPSSVLPLIRMVEHFGIDPDSPMGRYERPSWWKRLLGRR